MAQKFWWPASQRHYIRWYLNLPIIPKNHFISSILARYQKSKIYSNNSAARWVPPWSWPKSYRSRSNSGVWVQSQWMVIGQETVFRFLCPFLTRIMQQGFRYWEYCSPGWIEWHSDRWLPLWCHGSGIKKFYCPLSQRNIMVLRVYQLR